jgi:hypothetical protein
MADKKGTCWKCGNQLAEVYPAINGTPGFYVCDTPKCSENYAETQARETEFEKCKYCTHWIGDKFDAIGMGCCRHTSPYSMTAHNDLCGNFSQRPNTA